MKYSNVKVRYKDPDRNIIGTLNENLIINSIVYGVEFPDSVVKKYYANTIAEKVNTKVIQPGKSMEFLKKGEEQ